VPWIVVAAGAAVAASGAIVIASAASDASTRDDARRAWCVATACVDGTATRPETPDAVALRRTSADAASRGNTKEVIGGVLGGVGVVGIVVGSVLLLSSPEARPAPSIRSAIGRDNVGLDAAFRF
jgi:hypothetical protein